MLKKVSETTRDQPFSKVCMGQVGNNCQMHRDTVTFRQFKQWFQFPCRRVGIVIPPPQSGHKLRCTPTVQFVFQIRPGRHF
jgi:hypothetical protein